MGAINRNLIIELSSFTSLSSPNEAGALTDKNGFHLDILFCVFQNDTSTNNLSDTYKCAGAIFKEKGTITIRCSLFDRCYYTSGINNKGGNAACFVLASTSTDNVVIAKCAETESGDAPIRSTESVNSYFRSINMTDDHGTFDWGNGAFELTSYSSPIKINYCQFCASSGGRTMYYKENELAVMHSVFFNNTNELFFFEFTGKITFTFCCFKGNSNYDIPNEDQHELVFQQCNSDNSTAIPNAIAFDSYCILSTYDSVLQRLQSILHQRTKRCRKFNLSILPMFLNSTILDIELFKSLRVT